MERKHLNWRKITDQYWWQSMETKIIVLTETNSSWWLIHLLFVVNSLPEFCDYTKLNRTVLRCIHPYIITVSCHFVFNSEWNIQIPNRVLLNYKFTSLLLLSLLHGGEVHVHPTSSRLWWRFLCQHCGKSRSKECSVSGTKLAKFFLLSEREP